MSLEGKEEMEDGMVVEATIGVKVCVWGGGMRQKKSQKRVRV